MRQIIMETTKFKVFVVYRKEQHNLNENEKLLPRIHSMLYDDYILAWFNKEEKMVYRWSYGYIPQCYWEHIEALSNRIILNRLSEKNEIIDEVEKRIRCMFQVGVKHIEHKKKIKEFFKLVDWEDNCRRFCFGELNRWNFSKDEIFQAIDDVPLFISNITKSPTRFEPDGLDWFADTVIAKQIIDNRNASKGVITYECLEEYRKRSEHRFFSYAEWEFIRHQYEAKMKKKGRANVLQDGKYKEII